MIYKRINILLIKKLMFKTSMLISDLYDYCNTYIAVKGRITVEGDNDDRASHKSQS